MVREHKKGKSLQEVAIPQDLVRLLGQLAPAHARTVAEAQWGWGYRGPDPNRPGWDLYNPVMGDVVIFDGKKPWGRVENDNGRVIATIHRGDGTTRPYIDIHYVV